VLEVRLQLPVQKVEVTLSHDLTGLDRRPDRGQASLLVGHYDLLMQRVQVDLVPPATPIEAGLRKV
jgi:hypothetical protein